MNAETIPADLAAETIPSVVSISMAAKLSGLSRRALYKMLGDGIIDKAWIGEGFTRPGVTLADVEVLLGRRVSLSLWLAARAALNAGYERARKASQHV